MKPVMTAASVMILSVAAMALAANVPTSSAPHGLLFVANQFDHTVILVDAAKRKAVFTAGVDINGHEVTVSADGRFGYVPIYGNSGVGKPGTDGGTIQVVDLRAGRTIDIIDLPKPVRPHLAKFGPDGLLYVTAELANAIYAVDVHSHKVVAENPTGEPESHMLVISPDGARVYTANVSTGTVSVVDIHNHSLITTVQVADHVQRISISSDGRHIYTHDQVKPRIAVIDAATNKISTWIDLPATVYSSAPTHDGQHLIANSPSGKLFDVNLSTGKVQHTYDIPGALGAMVISPDDSRAYITCPQAGTIEILNLQENALETPISLTKGVDGITWLPVVPD
jgi:YVTN family beta-propeller protein